MRIADVGFRAGHTVLVHMPSLMIVVVLVASLVLRYLGVRELD